jgi:drug/metabolite transporter (DMT)-like permease
VSDTNWCQTPARGDAACAPIRTLQGVASASLTRRGWLLFAAMCVIWGIPYLLIRVAVRDVSPAVLVLMRTSIAAAILLPLAAARGELRHLRRYAVPLVAFAIVEIALPWVALGSAEEHLSSSLTGLLIAAVPLVGVVIARTTGSRERPGLLNIVGLLLGVAGVAAIVGVSVRGATLTPLAEVAVVAVCYAVGPFILQRRLSELPAFGVIASSLAITAVVYAPIAAFSLPDGMPSGTAVASVATLAVVCTAVAFVLFFKLIAEAGPVRATVITYVNPAVAAVLGVTILNEHFTVGMGIGFALVLAGSVLATRAGAPREQIVQAGELEPA